MAKEGFVEGSTWNPKVSKTTPTPQLKSEMHKPHQESTPKRFYKCGGLGNIAFKCPNRKVVAIFEEYEAKEEDLDEVVNSNHVQ